MTNKSKDLKISVYSFGFQKSGIPENEYDDGGGFVFDCRFLPNPFHDLSLRDFTGMDKEIRDFFEDYRSVKSFIDECVRMIEKAADSSIENGEISMLSDSDRKQLEELNVEESLSDEEPMPVIRLNGGFSRYIPYSRRRHINFDLFRKDDDVYNLEELDDYEEGDRVINITSSNDTDEDVIIMHDELFSISDKVFTQSGKITLNPDLKKLADSVLHKDN